MNSRPLIGPSHRAVDYHPNTSAGTNGALCGTPNRRSRCLLWVISVIFGARADVRFTPNSDRLLPALAALLQA